MRNTISFAFYCRESKTNKNGQAPVELSVIVNGKRHYLNLSLKCDPKEFNRKRRPQIIEDYLTATRQNINTYLVEMAQQGKAVTADALAAIIRTGGVHTYTIADLFADYEKILEKRIGVDMDINHFRKYTLVKDMFFQVVDKTREANTVCNADVLKFKAYIAGKLTESTQAGYMSRLKAYIRFGMANQKITTNPFEGVKIKRVEKPVVTIEKADIETIIAKAMPNERLNRVKELFLFSCGSGLAFADVCSLSPADFTEQDGKVCIFKARRKTGIKFYSVLLPFAAEIARKYSFDMSCLMLSNQKCNAYLKEIQTICDITSVDSLHFHLARHYYATNAINSGIPLEVVSKLVGHSNIKQTQHYAKLMESTIISEVSKVNFA